MSTNPNKRVATFKEKVAVIIFNMIVSWLRSDCLKSELNKRTKLNEREKLLLSHESVIKKLISNVSTINAGRTILSESFDCNDVAEEYEMLTKCFDHLV
jgi:hypothetical protein